MIISQQIFEPQLKYIDQLNDLCRQILIFCKKKEQFGASQQDIKVKNKKKLTYVKILEFMEVF